MKLFAEITDEDLFFKLMHELGCTLYRVVGNGEHEIVYFSGTKIVHFRGKVSDSNKELLKAGGWEVQAIEVDDVEGLVKITQK